MHGMVSGWIVMLLIDTLEFRQIFMKEEKNEQNQLEITNSKLIRINRDSFLL